MEGKMKAATLCCLLIIMLSGQLQQQVVAMSKFYGCYKPCYPDCKKHLPRWLCILKCMDDCSPNAEPVVVPTSAGDCNGICQQLSVCGMIAPETEIPYFKICLDDCNNHPGAYAYARTAANIN